MGIKTHATVCVGKFTVQLKIGEPLIDIDQHPFDDDTSFEN